MPPPITRSASAGWLPLASYLVINVSSPNTPGLRALQGREPLAELLDRALGARAEAIPAGGTVPPLLLKIAPDLTEEDKRDIAEVALSSGIDGLIVSNTTIARPPELPAGVAGEAGGLSGVPLMAASTAVLADMYRLTGGRIPLIGCGGIASGRDAYAKIRAGASLVQLYTALVYHGPRLVEEIRRDLATLLRADGFTGLRDAVGADHRQGSSAFSPDLFPRIKGRHDFAGHSSRRFRFSPAFPGWRTVMTATSSICGACCTMGSSPIRG